jgi:hypothetical protein
VIAFVAIKYVSLGMNAARSLVLAALLGPESYGLLGTLVIVQQYLSYAALGIREGVTVRLAQADIEARDMLRNSALAWGAGVGIAVLVVMCGLVQLRGMRPEWYWVGVISLLSITNEVLINIYRDDGRLNRVAVLEVVYNCVPLGCALLFGRAVTVQQVLQSLAAGVAFSVLVYLVGLPGTHARHASFRAVRSMLAVGIPMAIASFFSASVTSIYVLLAYSQHLGHDVGLIAFANNVCTIVLFGSNAVAWAFTSKSMRVLSSGPQGGGVDGLLQNLRLTYFFRVAVLVSVLAVSVSRPIVLWLIPSFGGMERYATLFCLLQATMLMLYVELNYLAVRGRSGIVAVGYGAVLALALAVSAVLGNLGIERLVFVGIALAALAGGLCAVYCHRLGLASASLRSNYFFLAFPSVGALALYAFDTWAVAAVAGLFLARALFTGRRLVSSGGLA